MLAGRVLFVILLSVMFFSQVSSFPQNNRKLRVNTDKNKHNKQLDSELKSIFFLLKAIEI